MAMLGGGHILQTRKAWTSAAARSTEATHHPTLAHVPIVRDPAPGGPAGPGMSQGIAFNAYHHMKACDPIAGPPGGCTSLTRPPVGGRLTTLPGAAPEDLALLGTCWRSIGLRSAVVEWQLDRPALLDGPLASRMRSALGPALAACGARSEMLLSIPGADRPSALWFLGWDGPPRPVLRLRAELRCVGVVAGDWARLEAALARIAFPPSHRPGPLARAERCSVTWSGAPDTCSPHSGPPPVDDPALTLPGGACVVEAVTPLQLRFRGIGVDEPPPLAILVRSAGERLRQLCLHWGAEAECLPPVVARAYREAIKARLSWARAGREPRVVRRSSSTGQRQVLEGVRGVFAYEGVTPVAMAFLALAQWLGVGKGIPFGCGQIRVH
jgi:hypothetical protein